MMASYVRGTMFTLYPMRRNGVAFTGAYLQFNIAAVQELQPAAGNEGKCDTDTTDPDQSFTISTVLRALNWTSMCCEVRTGWDMIEPTINRTTATVRISDPLHPNFFFEMEYSLINQSVSYFMPGSNNTGNRDYYYDYMYVTHMPLRHPLL